MTISELKNSAYTLADLSGADADAIFINSLSAALLTLYSDLKITGRKKIFINRTHPDTYIKRLVHRAGEKTILPFTGRAYSMTVSGVGYFTIYDGANSTKHTFDCDKKLYRGFISSGGSIEFSGDHLYYIYDFSLFDEALSDRTDDIPRGSDTRCIDLSDDENFLALLALPKTKDGRTLPGASYEDGTLLIPSDFEGELWLRYLKKPKSPVMDDEAVIDIPRSYEALLLPLLLSLMLTKEDADVAEQYRGIYKDMLENLRDIPKDHVREYVVTDGWA